MHLGVVKIRPLILFGNRVANFAIFGVFPHF